MAAPGAFAAYHVAASLWIVGLFAYIVGCGDDCVGSQNLHVVRLVVDQPAVQAHFQAPENLPLGDVGAIALRKIDG